MRQKRVNPLLQDFEEHGAAFKFGESGFLVEAVCRNSVLSLKVNCAYIFLFERIFNSFHEQFSVNKKSEDERTSLLRQVADIFVKLSRVVPSVIPRRRIENITEHGIISHAFYRGKRNSFGAQRNEHLPRLHARLHLLRFAQPLLPDEPRF